MTEPNERPDIRYDPDKWDLAEDGGPRWSIPMGFAVAQGPEGGVLMIEHADSFADGAEGKTKRVQLYFNAESARKLGEAMIACAEQAEAQANGSGHLQ